MRVSSICSSSNPFILVYWKLLKWLCVKSLMLKRYMYTVKNDLEFNEGRRDFDEVLLRGECMPVSGSIEPF